MAVVIVSTLVYYAHGTAKPKWAVKRETHKFKTLVPSKLAAVAQLAENSGQFDTYLHDIVSMTRVPGSANNEIVREKIISHIKDLDGWTVELDAFDTDTVIGRIHFANIIATLNPLARRRLVLACHYDTKIIGPIEENTFVGATDSAVPCAMMLDLVYHLDSYLKAAKDKDITLQLLFFDGEEAFHAWTNTDSLYGSRHLAEKMSLTRHPPNSQDTTELDAIDVFVLLDLLGARNPRIMNHYQATSKHFENLQRIEGRLHSGGLLSAKHKSSNPVFQGNSGMTYSEVQDDHIPFKQRVVPILHMITTPFPEHWHTVKDDMASIDLDTVDDLNRMLRVFVSEYLGLDI